MRRGARIHAKLASLIVGVLFARDARADRIADAEQLFRQAKAFVAAGKDAEACPLFAESNRLDPGVGTLLNLALCHEKTGRVASAWGEFRAVEQHARATHPDRAELARKHAEALEPRISRLRVAVAGGAAAPHDLVVKVDGEEKPKALWTGIAVDVGAHVVVASASGHVPREARVKVDDEGVTVDVALASLERVKEASPEAPKAADLEREEARRSRRTGGYIVGGAGLAVLAVGAGFGAGALLTDASVRDACPAPCVRGSGSADEADRRTARALDFATVSNVAIPVGAAAVLVGVYLVLTSRAPSISNGASSRGLVVRF